MAGFVTDKRLYLNADKTRVVQQGDPDAAFLFRAAGLMVTEAEAVQYGLSAPGSELLAAPNETEDQGEKALSAPPANKRIKGPKDDTDTEKKG